MERKYRLFPLFLGVEGILYGFFLNLDLAGRFSESVPAKYLAIALCLAMALTALRRPAGRLMAAALALTLLADTFLLLLDVCYPVGVACFCGVQALYLVRIRRAGGWPAPLCLVLRCGLAAAGLIGAGALGLLDPLTALALVYFSQLLCNGLESLFLRPRGAGVRLFSAGLLLFLGCDLCVGLHNLPLPIPTALTSFAAVGMWLFYLPSQVLLTLSGRWDFPPKGGTS